MPHFRNFRKRYLATGLSNLLDFSPLVGVMGHRQVGKTTLAASLGKSYFSLDLRTTFDEIASDPLGFLSSVKKFPAVLDECQTMPELFPALKEYVRLNKRPGAFLLTGSVRFTSRKAIRESLTGRIISIDLLPMNVAEIHGMPLPQGLLRLSNNFDLVNKIEPNRSLRGSVEEYLIRGGLPGVFFVRDKSLRIQKLATQLDTILDRDLRLLTNTTLSFLTLRTILGYIAQHQGESLNLTAMSRATRVTRPTLMKLLRAFEGLFLIRSLATEGGTTSRVYYLEDQGEASYLIGNRTDPLYDFGRFLYANLRLQILYRPQWQAEMFRYQTRGGALVPLCFRLFSKELGVMPILTKNPNQSEMAIAGSFLRKYPYGKLVFATPDNELKKLSDRLCIVPITDFVLF